MSAPSDKHDTAPTPPDRSTVILLLGDIANTTWRMFVPTLLFIGLGFWADSSWHTKPWLTIAGLIIGVAITTELMRRQFKRIRS